MEDRPAGEAVVDDGGDVPDEPVAPADREPAADGPDGAELDDPDGPEVPPPAPRWRSWRFWVGGLGRVLITLGVLTLLFAAYQLWGTGITHARAQSSLEKEFEARRATELTAAPTTTAPTTTAAPTTTRPPSTSASATTAAPTTATPTTAAPTTATPTTVEPTTLAPTTVAPAAPLTEPIVQGDGIARIVIPAIDVDEIVVAGVSRKDLQRGPGHFPDTPLPGQLGNVGIAGHRTTYGAPFGRLDELKVGDVIEITTFTGDFRYVVTEQLIVKPSDTYVVGPSPDAVLTLTTCNPKYSARQRLVIKAALDVPQSSPVAPPTPNAYETSGAPPDDQDAVVTLPAATEPSGPTSTAGSTGSTATTATTGGTTVSTGATTATSVPASPQPAAGAVDELTAGWFSDSSAWWPTIAWATLGLLAAAAAWLWARRWRRVPAYVLAALPMAVILYFFFENLSRLLPPSI